MTDGSVPDDRERALALLKRYGWNATSFQCLEPGTRYWFDRDVEACVAYVDTGAAWVAAGAPIAAGDELAPVADRFLRAAGEAGRRACFFATEARFLQALPLRACRIGEQPVWDPSRWERALQAGRSLREQLRRARARGVTVRAASAPELLDRASPARQAVDRLLERWLASRRLAPMGFLVQVHPFDFGGERRFFVAEHGGAVVGFLSLVPVYARNGWLFEDLLRDPEAPNGTTEALVDAAMRAIGDEGSRYATLGLAPLAGSVSGWLRWVRRWSSEFYDFEGIRAFKARFRPDHWEPIHLSYPPDQSLPLTLFDALTAFAPHGPLRFGWHSLLRRPALALQVLAWLLVPWTVLLASVPTEAWFPSRWVQWGWVVFDAALVVGLLALARRWRDWLATLLAVVITGDAALTLVEALIYNVPRLRSPVQLLVILLAVAAPTLAAAFLWRARGVRDANARSPAAAHLDPERRPR
jgi:phosphatidylglycerol lysyltransferase